MTAITRTESTYEAPTGVKVAKVDYSDASSIAEALQGIEVLIITMAVTAPPEQHTILVDAAAKAGVPWVLPNEWGTNLANEQVAKDTLLGAKLTKYRKEIENLGVSSWIGITCGFWYEYSLSASTYPSEHYNTIRLFPTSWKVSLGALLDSSYRAMSLANQTSVRE